MGEEKQALPAVIEPKENIIDNWEYADLQNVPMQSAEEMLRRFSDSDPKVKNQKLPQLQELTEKAAEVEVTKQEENNSNDHDGNDDNEERNTTTDEQKTANSDEGELPKNLLSLRTK